jgi:cyclopropane fatty-acyl-phospholipid synthase-like methyltransferase
VGFALLKRDSGEDTSDTGSDGVSLKARLHAWWNGYELRPTDAAPSAAKSESGNAKDAGGDADADPSGSAAAADAKGAWSDARRQLAQEIWSPGFVVPGGNDYVEKLINGCSLTEAETMLEIGVGMGGCTRTIIGKFGNYVTGYERDADLAAAAVRHAVTYDIDDKLEVVNVPFESLELKKSYFRATLIRDILYTVENKCSMLTKVADSLKTGESFLVMTDFLFDADNESPELKAWKAVEERPVYPWTEAELTKCLSAAEVQPRIVENEGEEYCAMVVRAWSEYLKSVEGKEISDEMGHEMKREGDYWARRCAAIQSGDLKYFRIECVKIS